MADVQLKYSQSVYCKCTSSLATGALVEMPPKYISKVHLKHSRSITEVYPKCTLSITEVARRLAATMLPPHRSLLLCRSRLAAAVHACCSCLTAPVALSHHCCCAALALLLLCRSHLTAAVPLSLGSCCMWRSRIAPVCGALNRTAAAVAL